MISAKDTTLFFQLLAVSDLFPGQASKQLIKAAVEKEVLPEVDFHYLFDLLKTEKNMHYLVDKKANEMIQALKQKKF